MKTVILVGGKGERLMPLTKNTRKAYLPLSNKRVVDHIIDRLPKGMSFSILENDSGAIAAISSALKGSSEPVMIICGDNYFGDTLDVFVSAFKGDTLVGIYDTKDKRQARQLGIVELYPDGQIKRIIEKPAQPQTTLVSTGLYLFPPVVFYLINYFAELYPTKNPGDLIDYIIATAPVYGYPLNGIWFDIGTKESYQEALEYIEDEFEVSLHHSR